MPAITSQAPGKSILFGEHAVVYARPAIAVPINKVSARAVILANPQGSTGEIRIDAPDIGLKSTLSDLPEQNPLALAINLAIQELSLTSIPSFTIRITSTIPIASGLGSGAAITVSILRAVSTFFGHPFPDEVTNRLAYEVEKIYHGNPSGIDNTVITYSRPIYYIRGKPFEVLHVNRPFSLIIGNTGIPGSTAKAVEEVKQRWIANTLQYESWFDQIGAITNKARDIIERKSADDLGILMIKNHALLRMIGVSSPELDRLVEAALKAGASGAKLCGGGLGGNMIALVKPETIQPVREALQQAGAKTTILTTILPN